MKKFKHAPMSAVALSLLLASAWTVPVVAETAGPTDRVRLPATRDVWVSAVNDETDFNMGAAKKLKLKVTQEFALLDFDPSQLQGRRIKSAHLYLKPAGGDQLGLNAGSDLRWLTLSSVSHPWTEGKSNGYHRDFKGKGATFNESSFQTETWGWPGAKIWNVILGNGNTLSSTGELEAAAEGWLRVTVDQDLISAMVAGASYGLAVIDGSTEVISNSYVRSRESGQGPFLEIEVGPRADPTLHPPTAASLRPAPRLSTADFGALELTFQVPEGAFAYDLTIDGRQMPRWQIPFASVSGAWQTLSLFDLPPTEEVDVSLYVIDPQGNRSRPILVRGRASAAFEAPELNRTPFKPRPAAPPNFGQTTVWAFPELTEVDPVTTTPLFSSSSGDLRTGNEIWDGAAGTIRLAAARGEIISFQIAVEGRATRCRVDVAALQGPTEIGDDEFKLWQVWYVERQSEYAIPLLESFDVPSAAMTIEGQKLQAIVVDLHIPPQASPGIYKAPIAVSCNEGRAEMNLDVAVYDVAIPEDLNFLVELNSYRGPGEAGSRKFVDSFRLAHYHRATINRVPYSHRGQVNRDWAPDTDRTGRIVDWSRFDANLGGLLDGSWFQDNPRAGVPVPVLYLPLFEGWPLDFRDHYNPTPGPVDTRQARLKHDLLAPPIEKAIDSRFQDSFLGATRAFRDHLQDRGWHRTIFQLYLNNKPRYGYTLWMLDEPFKQLDWEALNFFGRLFKQGVDDPETYTRDWQESLFQSGLAGLDRQRPTLVFRADVSRPMWQGNISDGIINWLYVGNSGYRVPRLLDDLKHRAPTLLSQYGSAPPPTSSNWIAANWPLTAFLSNFDGILPWQSLGGPGALQRPDPHALLIDAGERGHAVASLRLHGFRRGAQLCELLRLLQIERGWSRQQLRLFVTKAMSQIGATSSTPVSYNPHGPPLVATEARHFLRLKEGILQLLATDPR